MTLTKKTSGVCGLIKKTDYNPKISDIEKKYFTTSDYSKFTNDILNAKLKEKKMYYYKSAIAGFINNADLGKKVGILATKSELKVDQDKIIKLPAFDSNNFSSKSHFEDDGTQNYLVFHPTYRYFKKIWQ